MSKVIRSLLLLVFIAASQPVFAQDAVFGDFEGTTIFGPGTGWFDWGDPDGIATISTTTGVTSGNQSLKWQPGAVGFYQGLSVKIQDLPSEGPQGDVRSAAFQGFLNNTHIAYDVTWDNADWNYTGDGWNGSQLYEIAINYGPGGTYQGMGFADIDTGNPDTPSHWDPVNYPGVHTRTVMWDYSAHKDAIAALYATEALTEVNGWLEFVLATNAGNFTYPVAYYFDNVRFTTPSEGIPGDFDGDGIVDGHDLLTWQRGQSPSQADLTLWQNNFGMGAALSASIAVVPEPSSLAMLLVGFGIATASRRRR
jgi:hypothetical protein